MCDLIKSGSKMMTSFDCLIQVYWIQTDEPFSVLLSRVSSSLSWIGHFQAACTLVGHFFLLR